MGAAPRHRCRNPRCRSKLPAPADNPHRAFCTRGCYESFYRSRCRVCEADLRKRDETTGKAKIGDAGRRYCRPPNKCRQEAAKWPQKYEYGVRYAQSTTPSTCADETGLKSAIKADRPSHKALGSWSWHSEDLEHELRDAAGTLLARLESNGGRHRLTCPRTFPVLSWADLAEAKHRAESIALSALPPDPATAARIKRDNATPHPMGAPLSLEALPVVDSPPIAPPEPFEGDPLEIPAFLRRVSP
jgi:hypothetical protein